MTKKRFTHDGVVIIDYFKKDLIYIDGNDNLLDLAEYVDKLQNENEQLKRENEMLQEEVAQCKAVIDNKWSEYLKGKVMCE